MKNNKKIFNWIGGKSWLSKELNKEILKFKNKNLDTYCEPFVGGLGAFINVFDSLKKIGIKNFILNDINTPLINTYINIKNNPIELFNCYLDIELNYLKTIPNLAYKLHKINDKLILKKELLKANSFYNEQRAIFNNIKNNNSIKTSAIFLFITQHNFNGIYRGNKSGHFNIPYNWDIRKINPEERLKLIQDYSNFFNNNNIQFLNLNCFSVIENLKPYLNNSLLYLDPPYINDKSKENNYNQESFSKNIQIELIEKIIDYPNFLFSNHEHEIFKKYSKDFGLKIKKYNRLNTISQNPNSRKDLKKEILIINNKTLN